MPILNYAIPPFRLLIGAFDCTDYLDSFAINLPMQEISQRLTWSGTFEVSYNLTARSGGLLEADFDQNQTPQRWRPAQQLVRMLINNYPLPALRIERYAYNPQTGIGKGTLYQSLDAVASPRPASEQELPVYSTAIPAVANQLLQIAYQGATIGIPGDAGAGTSSAIVGGVNTRDPVNECQQLIGKFWRALTVDTAEVAKSISCAASSTPLFARTLTEIEFEPDINHINFAAPKVIVTGSYQRERRPDPNAPDPIKDDAPGQPRPKLQQTTSKQPFNKVFEGASGQANNFTPTTSERKSIGYLYPDDRTIPFAIAAMLPTAALFPIQSEQPIIGAAADTAYITITVQEWPAGRIFSSLGTNTALYPAIITVQSEKLRIIYKPAGVLSGRGTNFTLVPAEEEKLTTTPVSPRSNQATEIDPRTGQLGRLEPKLQLEARQLVPDIPLETVPVCGEAVVVPTGWQPVVQRNLLIDVGFLPGRDIANLLAKNIATREARRRDSAVVTMPIPIEWLQSSCPTTPTIRLWDGDWLAEGLILAMDSRNGEAKFAFTGARINRLVGGIYIPVDQVASRILFKSRPFATITSRTLPPPITSALPVVVRPFATIINYDNSGGGLG